MTPLSENEAAAHPSAGPRPGAMLEQKEAMGQVLRVLETLPKNQREVIYLKFQCELSYKEISEITRLSVSNVGFLIHTAIQALRKQILANPEALRRTQ
jgi:RNA polymerase sigma-70 factor (ECF subfamily)